MAKRPDGPKAPRIKSGSNYGKPRARTTAKKPPGGSARWRAKRSDAGKPRKK